jgi:hypothetical protein
MKHLLALLVTGSVMLGASALIPPQAIDAKLAGKSDAQKSYIKSTEIASKGIVGTYQRGRYDPQRGGILPIPPSFATGGLGWHNWKVAGWKTIGGAPYLICKMWAGPDYGDRGFVYMSRELARGLCNEP